MTAVTGDFEEAVRESNRVLAVRGQVLPATSVPLNLSARLASGRSTCTARSGSPAPMSRSSTCSSSRPTCAPTGEALERILEAEMIVIGPGSLFSSVLPNLLISDVRDALAAAAGPQGLRLQRRDPARRDRQSMTASAAPRGALRPRRRRPDRLRHPQPQHRRAPAAEGWRAEPVEVDVRRLEELPVVIVEEDVDRPDQCPPPRPRQARGRAHAAPAGGPDRAAARSAASGRPAATAS